MQEPIREMFKCYMSVSLHGLVKYPWRGFIMSGPYSLHGHYIDYSTGNVNDFADVLVCCEALNLLGC